MNEAMTKFVNGLKYIKKHNSEDDNTNSLDFDSEYLNLPDTDFEDLLSSDSLDDFLDKSNLTWQNDDNGGLYILPQLGHVSNGDGLSVNELLKAVKKYNKEK